MLETIHFFSITSNIFLYKAGQTPQAQGVLLGLPTSEWLGAQKCVIFGTGTILIGNLDGTSEIGANISHFPPTSKQRLTQSQIATYYHQSAFTQCIAACYYTLHYTTARKENDLLRPPHSGQTQSQSFYLIKVGTRKTPSAALLYLVQTCQPIFFRKVDLDDHLDFKSMVVHNFTCGVYIFWSLS